MTTVMRHHTTYNRRRSVDTERIKALLYPVNLIETSINVRRSMVSVIVTVVAFFFLTAILSLGVRKWQRGEGYGFVMTCDIYH